MVVIALTDLSQIVATIFSLTFDMMNVSYEPNEWPAVLPMESCRSSDLFSARGLSPRQLLRDTGGFNVLIFFFFSSAADASLTSPVSSSRDSQTVFSGRQRVRAIS